MSLVLVDGSMIRSFVQQDVFTWRVNDMFDSLDKNSNKFLTKAEIRPAIEKLNLLDMQMGEPVKLPDDELNAFYDEIFAKFDIDANGVVDRDEFCESIKNILLAIADGLGSSPLLMLVDEDSLINQAAKSVRLTRTLSRYAPKSSPSPLPSPIGTKRDTDPFATTASPLMSPVGSDPNHN
ncbi:hypothetical protein CBR_g4493 [Chara braunii]|uniref:EF-hand domain-containing protein n=1 Tax=Chara braunii TaxID=69332 RepID=A0A388KI76_CHABU|nr:hypothetical protein CBR_g4493 [Chara braunii]|eukprot:GBG69663.1 hypothetical protein CBR_g4493 [Chara braunii]